MNIPTQLTLLRMLLAGVIPCVLLADRFAMTWVALGLFVVGALTDYWDGWLARRAGQITPGGQLLDPVADKCLVLLTLTALAWLDGFPLWLVGLIAVREIGITVLRLAWRRRGIVVAAAKEGKLKTVLQMTTVVVAFLCLAVAQGQGAGAGDALRVWHTLVMALLWATLVVTWWSGWRVVQCRDRAV